MIKDYFIVYNPTSGKGKSNKIINDLKIDLDKIGKMYDIKKTQYPNHAKKICQNIKVQNIHSQSHVYLLDVCFCPYMVFEIILFV